MTEKSPGPAGGKPCEVRPDERSSIQEDQSGTNTPHLNPAQASAVARERLPNRRASESFTFERDGIRYTATVTFFSAKRLAEIFIDTAKPGSAIAEYANDAAILASLLLQHGVSAAAIKHSLSGPLATALTLAEAQQTEQP
jgi:hypothetical protein